MHKEYLNILVFGQKTTKTRRLRIHKKTFKIVFYLLAFAFFCTIFFFCDYIQLKKKGFELSHLRQETEIQKSEIQLFSARIEDLENQLSKLKGFHKKIRILSNLEKGMEDPSAAGIGVPSPSDIRDMLQSRRDDKGLVQQMRSDIERLQSEATSREESLSDLERLLEDKKDTLSHTPSIWPTMGWVTSGFDFRTDPFTELSQMHEGIDIANRMGTPVIAPGDGIISDTGNDLAYGNMLVISHGIGMTSRYAHLDKILVKVGQKVKRGEEIAEVGMSGKATGPHLHYEIRLNDIPVDPMRYILN